MTAQETDPEQVASAYDPETYARLGALKRTWDPTNRLRVNTTSRRIPREHPT